MHVAIFTRKPYSLKESSSKMLIVRSPVTATNAGAPWVVGKQFMLSVASSSASLLMLMTEVAVVAPLAKEAVNLETPLISSVVAVYKERRQLNCFKFLFLSLSLLLYIYIALSLYIYIALSLL